MNFYWNAFSLYNIFIDFLILIGCIFSFYYFFKKENLEIFSPDFISKKYIFTFLKSFLILFLTGSIIGILLRISSFLRAHILWTSATVYLPLFLLIHLVKNKKYFLLPIIISVIAFKYYAEQIEPNDLEVERITIRTNKIKKKIKITHISDLQTDNIRKLHYKVRTISNEFDPHLILFTGDVLNHISIQEEVEKYFSGFKKIDSSYFVSGNVDNILNLEIFTERSGFIFLDDKSKLLKIEDNLIGLIGISLWEYRNEELIDKLSNEVDKAEFKILMSHYPDTILSTNNSKPDLILAGHTHGGQVCLPFIGPIITLSNVPRNIAAGGLHFYNGIKIIVSRGLGMEGHVAPRIRILDKPHLVLLELVPE